MLELPKRNTTKRNTHTKATLAKVVPITQERIKMKEVSDVATMLTNSYWVETQITSCPGNIESNNVSVPITL